MASRASLDLLKAGGFHRSLKLLFPVRQELGDVTREEFMESIRRKLCFDLEIPSLMPSSTFKLGSTIMNNPIATGVAVVQLEKKFDALHVVRLGECCYDIELQLGCRRISCSDGDFVEQKDCSHVTQEMIQEKLRNCIGLRFLPWVGRPSPSEAPDVMVAMRPAIFHEIQLKSFQSPLVKLHIRCGAGFNLWGFVSVLENDLNTVADVTKLHRSRQGPFTYEDALPSYAISWDKCKALTEKFSEPFKRYKYETLRSFSDQELKMFLTEKSRYRLRGWNKESRERKERCSTEKIL